MVKVFQTSIPISKWLNRSASNNPFSSVQTLVYCAPRNFVDTFKVGLTPTWCILARGMSWRTSCSSWVRHSRSSPPTLKQEMVWPSSAVSRKLRPAHCVTRDGDEMSRGEITFLTWHEHRRGYNWRQHSGRGAGSNLLGKSFDFFRVSYGVVYQVFSNYWHFRRS